MKALKLAMVAAFVSFTLMSFAQDFQQAAKPDKMKVIALSVAKGMPDVAYAIKTQIDPRYFLTGGDHTLYIACVKVKHRTYRVCGTYMEWYDFFYAKKQPVIFEKPCKPGKKTE